MTLDEFEQYKKHGLNQLFYKIIEALQEFKPVAIYQFGTGSRGDGDEFSDLDIFTVVKDQDFEQIIQDRIKTYENIGPILVRLFKTEPHHKGWYHDLIIYDFPSGLFHVDIYITPRSKVILPQNSKLIQGEPDLPNGDWTSDIQTAQSGNDLHEEILAMTYIGVKGLVRNWGEDFFNYLKMLYGRLQQENRNVTNLPVTNNFKLIEVLTSNLKRNGTARQQIACQKIADYAKLVAELCR